jgi:hypothetical protein
MKRFIYERTGDFTNKYFHHADPTIYIGSPRFCINRPIMNNRTLPMYGVTWGKRPIFSESDAFLYSLGDPNIRVRVN